MRRALVACVLVLAGCGSQVEQGTLPTEEAPVSSISPPGKTYLEQAKRDGAQTVTLLVSVKEGQQEQVEKALKELGAAVEARDPKIGYLKAEVPIDKANDVPNIAGVSKVDVDEPLNNRLPEP